MSDNIQGFKLLSGQEMIGKLIEETDAGYVVEDALFWDAVQLAEGKYDIQFAALTYGAKIAETATHPGLNLTIPRMTVLFLYNPRRELDERYRQLISPIALIHR